MKSTVPMKIVQCGPLNPSVSGIARSSIISFGLIQSLITFPLVHQTYMYQDLPDIEVQKASHVTLLNSTWTSKAKKMVWQCSNT